MTRTSPAEVRGLFRRVVAAAGRAGVDTEDWRLCEGRAWWMIVRMRGDDWPDNLPNAVLGRNPREASLSLLAMERAYESVVAACATSAARTGPRRATST